MSSIYQKLPMDIQDIILNKIFKQRKIWTKKAINSSIKSYYKVIEHYKLFKNIGVIFTPSNVKNVNKYYRKHMKKSLIKL